VRTDDRSLAVLSSSRARARAREVVVFCRLGLATRVARMSDELFVAMHVAATGRSKNDGSLAMDYRQVT